MNNNIKIHGATKFLIPFQLKLLTLHENSKNGICLICTFCINFPQNPVALVPIIIIA